jgi:hypothetical protein
MYQRYQNREADMIIRAMAEVLPDTRGAWQEPVVS